MCFILIKDLVNILRFNTIKVQHLGTIKTEKKNIYTYIFHYEQYLRRGSEQLVRCLEPCNFIVPLTLKFVFSRVKCV